MIPLIWKKTPISPCSTNERSALNPGLRPKAAGRFALAGRTSVIEQNTPRATPAVSDCTGTFAVRRTGALGFLMQTAVAQKWWPRLAPDLACRGGIDPARKLLAATRHMRARQASPLQRMRTMPVLRLRRTASRPVGAGHARPRVTRRNCYFYGTVGAGFIPPSSWALIQLPSGAVQGVTPSFPLSKTIF